MEAPDIVEKAMIWFRTIFSLGWCTGLLLGAEVYTWSQFPGVLWVNLAAYAALFFLIGLYRERFGNSKGQAY